MQDPTSVVFVHKQILKTGFVSHRTINLNSKKTYFSFKRAFDVFFSISIILFVFSWLYPIIAILIKLDSRGPVFFKQKRVGLHGRIFNCLKFRSMYLNKEADKKQCTTDDPRITRVGKFLRLICLDELPQFFNVLRGDMTLVGPRPHMISDCEKFRKEVSDYHVRHIVKPGITGIAQVKGCRGETNGFLDIYHRFQWDMFYIRNANFKFDLLILHKTVLLSMRPMFKLLQTKPKPRESFRRIASWKN
ncbi:MAG: sugar transferase [Bacteroidetes bacterium]|nr:sugar transferase [Bacteroidota bacterium]